MEILSAGYQDLRQYISTNWSTLKVLDASNAVVTTIALATDTRVSVLADYTHQEMQYKIVLKGSDSDIGVGKVVAGTQLYKGTTAVGAIETFTSFTFENSADTLNITVHIQVPKVV